MVKKNFIMVIRKCAGTGRWGGVGGGLWLRWLEHTVQRALVHDFRGPFPPIHGMAPHPPSSPFSLCVPPFLEPKVGGATLACGWTGGANSDVWTLERKPGTLFTLPVSSKLLIHHHQSINHRWMDKNDTEISAKLVIDHVANKSVHYDSVGTLFWSLRCCNQ